MFLNTLWSGRVDATNEERMKGITEVGSENQDVVIIFEETTRKKFLSLSILRELDEYTKSGSKRPARLYSFDKITLDSKRGHFFS